MTVQVRPYVDSDHDALLGLLRSPDIRGQYEIYDAPDGVERVVDGVYTPRAGVQLAFVGSEPVGFACAIMLPGPPRAFTVFRGAVLERHRRRGIGRALYESVREYALTQVALDIRELAFSAWDPIDPAEAMATSLGYRYDRTMWLMERPRGRVAEPEWPAGITVRTLNGSDDSLRDWNAAFNESVAGT